MTAADGMSLRAPGSPPAVTDVEISDPTTANDTIEVLEQDVVSLGSERLRARRVTVRLEGGLVLYTIGRTLLSSSLRGHLARP
jgi:hypothetical protein